MGLFGIVGDLLSKPKAIRNYYDDSIRDAVGPLTTRLGAAGTSNDADVQAYSNAMKAAAANAQQYDAQDAATLGGAINRASRQDGLATYERLRSGNLGALKGFAGDLSSMGLRDNNLALAARGYGGSKPGSYEAALRMDRISKNLAPVASGIFSGLAPGVSTVSAANTENQSNLIAMIAARYGVPFRTAQAALAPALARNQLLSGEIANMGDLGDVARTNVAGFQIKDRPISNALKNFDSQLASLANTAFAGRVGGDMTGGAGGIMNLLGFGGGRQSAPHGMPALTPGMQYQAAPLAYSPWGYSSMKPPEFGTSSFTFTGK